MDLNEKEDVLLEEARSTFVPSQTTTGLNSTSTVSESKNDKYIRYYRTTIINMVKNKFLVADLILLYLITLIIYFKVDPKIGLFLAPAGWHGFMIFYWVVVCVINLLRSHGLNQHVIATLIETFAILQVFIYTCMGLGASIGQYFSVLVKTIDEIDQGNVAYSFGGLGLCLLSLCWIATGFWMQAELNLPWDKRWHNYGASIMFAQILAFCTSATFCFYPMSKYRPSSFTKKIWIVTLFNLTLLIIVYHICQLVQRLLYKIATERDFLSNVINCVLHLLISIAVVCVVFEDQERMKRIVAVLILNGICLLLCLADFMGIKRRSRASNNQS